MEINLKQPLEGAVIDLLLEIIPDANSEEGEQHNIVQLKQHLEFPSLNLFEY